MLEERGRKASIRYLQLRGYDVLDENYDGFVICADEDDRIHIVDVSISEKYTTCLTDKSREDFEQVMCKWLAQQDKYIDVEICPDVCNLIVLSDSRALVRHYVNVQELV